MTAVDWRDARLGEWHVAELAAGRVHYAEVGAGDPVLFVHGGLCNANIWRGVVPQLAGEYRCIVPDLPQGSHREPMRPDADLTPPGQVRLLVELLDRLGIDQVLVVSNDAGGALSQMLTAAYPERVRALVLSSCDTYGQFPPRYLKPVHAFAQIPGVGPALGWAWTWGWLQQVFVASLVRRPLPPEVFTTYLGPLQDRGISRDLLKFFAGIRGRHTKEAARRLATFPRPALVVWGGNDLWFSRRNARRLVRELPDARLEVLPDCRTLVPEDQPVRFSALVAEFFRTRVDADALESSSGLAE